MGRRGPQLRGAEERELELLAGHTPKASRGTVNAAERGGKRQARAECSAYVHFSRQSV